MSDVARDLRRSSAALAREQSAEERLVLALLLGDSDLALFRAAGPAQDAQRRLERQRAAGRRPSSCGLAR